VTDDKPIAEAVPELGPCPFCGTSMDPFVVQQSAFGRLGERFMVCCDGCDAMGPATDEMEDAIAAWNRRAPPDLVRALVEALEEAMDSRAQDLAEAEHPGWYDRARDALHRAKEAGV